MRKYISIILVSVIALIVWLPMWMLMSGSLMAVDEIKTAFGPVLMETKGLASWPLFPKYPTVRPYVELLLDSPEFFAMFWNSVKLVVPILIGQVLIAIPAAWGFARFNFKGKKLLFTLYITLMLMPFQVTMVPHYLVLDQMNLLNTRWAVILPGIFSTFPVFIMYRFFKAIPEAMLEAVAIDGAGHFRAFYYIGMPLGIPGVMAALVLGFLEYWNMLEQPLTFLQDKSLWPLSLYLPNIGIDNIGVSITASVIMLVPALLIFLWGQNYLEAGIRVAGIKE
ncbi:MAG: carbohydrate ABC transporter permease [Cellulosilyticaceae bacterium]